MASSKSMNPRDPEAAARFFRFIAKRHQITLARAAGKPWPWTGDPILQDYKFTNVFRELDRVTIWLRQHWREPYADHPNLWFAMALARQINWPPTLEELGFPDVWDADKALRILEARSARKEKIYTGAYVISGTLGGSKISQTTHKVLDPLFKNPITIDPGSTLESIWEMFCKRTGYAGFLSYEVVTDLRHTRYLCSAPDIMTWANAGPGAMRGINRMFGVPLNSRLPKTTYLLTMQELLRESTTALAEYVPSLELREIEHCLCEWDKYERVRLGQGRPRSRFTPPHARE